MKKAIKNNYKIIGGIIVTLILLLGIFLVAKVYSYHKTDLILEAKKEKLEASYNLKKEASKVEHTLKLPPLAPKQENSDVIIKAFNFIKKYEGLRLEAYWDSKHWSIGYGNRSYFGEVITKQEAQKRIISYIKNIRSKWKLKSYDDNIEIALISFIYNTGSPPKGYKRYIENGHLQALKNRMKLYTYSNGVRLKGLILRREKEVNLF